MRLYLVDGSGYIFRAFHALPQFSPASPTACPTGAVAGFCNMLWKFICEMKAGGGETGAPTHLAVIFDASEKTFRSDPLPRLQGAPPAAAAGAGAAVPAGARGDPRLRRARHRARRVRGRRPDRLLCPRRGRGRGRGGHRLLRQGPDAAGQRADLHVRPDEEPEDLPRAGDREVRPRPRKGDRDPGPGRRQRRQRAGRPRHRHQDRGPAADRVRRPRHAAGPRRTRSSSPRSARP